MSQPAGKPDEIGLVADGIDRTVVGELQGIGHADVLDGVVGGVGAHIITVTVEEVVQVVVQESASQIGDIQCVTESSEILPFFVLDIHVVDHLARVLVNQRFGIAEHHGKAAQIIGYTVVAGVAVSEI